MDDSRADARLDRIEQRQYLIIGLLVVPYLVVAAEFAGVWVAGVLGAGIGLFTLFTIIFYSSDGRPTV